MRAAQNAFALHNQLHPEGYRVPTALVPPLRAMSTPIGALDWLRFAIPVLIVNLTILVTRAGGAGLGAHS
jgi:hypothetical protein